jgi:putative colanic acid biosynthesis acetyltransferase WcaF
VTEPDGPIFQKLNLTAKRPYTPRVYAGRILWKYFGAPMFRFSLPRAFRYRRWILRRFGAKLARNTYIYPSVDIFHPWWFTVGDHSTIGHEVVIYNLGPVSIGNHTVISQGAYVCAGTHDYTQPNLPLQRPPVNIGNGVWIAAQAFIGPGVTVGDNSVIAARAVVVKDVPSGVVVGGNPAKVIKPRLMRPYSDAAASST